MGPRVCDWCTRTSRKRTRVQCERVDPRTGRTCGAHRELELSPNCLVCGGVEYSKVPPTAGDVDEILADLTVLAGDLISADPSPEHVAIADALAVAHTKVLNTRLMPRPIAVV